MSGIDCSLDQRIQALVELVREERRVGALFDAAYRRTQPKRHFLHLPPAELAAMRTPEARAKAEAECRALAKPHSAAMSAVVAARVADPEAAEAFDRLENERVRAIMAELDRRDAEREGAIEAASRGGWRGNLD